MTKTGSGRKNRNVFKSVNKYQDRIILLTFVPTIIVFLVFIVIVFIGNPIVTRAVFHSSYPQVEKLILQFSALIVIGMFLVLLVSLVLSFIISHHLVGCFDRINKELDDIIAGKSTRPLVVRPGDELGESLLKRINVLREGYIKSLKEKN